MYTYTIRVIKSYRHKGLKRFAETGSKGGIQPKHADRLRRLLTALDVASMPQDMDAPGNQLHALDCILPLAGSTTTISYALPLLTMILQAQENNVTMRFRHFPRSVAAFDRQRLAS